MEFPFAMPTINVRNIDHECNFKYARLKNILQPFLHLNKTLRKLLGLLSYSTYTVYRLYNSIITFKIVDFITQIETNFSALIEMNYM